MYINNKDLTKVLGNKNIKLIRPKLIFDELIISFLNEIHKFCSKRNDAKIYPDLYTFSFWCREKNIRNLFRKYNDESLRIGRGLVLHITPSNVPMNFAYSFAFGILSGNYNIIRLPSKNFEQINILCSIIKTICNKKKYKEILNYFLFIHYKRSDEISNFYSSISDARLIWGGDKTIEEFKKYKTQPRCVDLYFANRFSFSIIKPLELKKLSNKNYNNFIKNFYNDTYLMDQRGCSSPKLIVWNTSTKNIKIEKQIISKFWKDFENVVISNYDNDLSSTNKKISLLFNDILTTKLDYKIKFKIFNVIRLKFSNISKELDDLNNSFGTFAEININDLNKINKFITKKYQTLTYFGLDYSEIIKLIENNAITGIDRIVKIGLANNMEPFWDGFDILRSLSRLISDK